MSGDYTIRGAAAGSTVDAAERFIPAELELLINNLRPESKQLSSCRE